MPDSSISQNQDSHAWYSHGNALYELGRYEGAVSRFDKVLEVDPNNYEAWNNRGYALYEMGSYETAIASFERCIELKPKFA